MTPEAKEELRKIFKDNGLSKDDIFSKKLKDKYGNEKEFVIITRPGIEKIEVNNGIRIELEATHVEKELCVVKCYATMGDKTIETFSSATPQNCQTPYLMEMAEKRARARGVLKLMKLYAHGVFSEDESPEFERNNPDNTMK